MARTVIRALALAPVLFAVLLLPGCGGSGNGEAEVEVEAEVEAEPDTGPTTNVTIEGTVTERGTGDGVGDVVVSGVHTDTGDDLFEATTDASGVYEASFEVTDVPNEVRVEAEKDNLEPATEAFAFAESVTADLELAWGSPFDGGGEDCLGLDPEAVAIEEFGEDWRIVQGSRALLLFDEFEQVQRARNIIQLYGFTEHCFVARPDPPMSYWLIEGTPPKTRDATPFGEDCLTHDPENIEIEQFGDDFRIVEGDRALLLFNELASAQAARDIIQFYGFTQQCFVGRPDAPMTYWLR